MTAGLGRWALLACLTLAAAALIPAGLATAGGGLLTAAVLTRGPTEPRARSDSAPRAEAVGGFAGAPSARLTAPSPAAGTSPLGLIAGWQELPALNQYARGSYASGDTWLAWRDADCSAAALAWLLAAYGQPLASLDVAIALVGNGISTRLGLLDARGPALARALATRGLTPRTPGGRPLGSPAELRTWLDRGPLLMDGGHWFGEGHWFVGLGYDAGGVFIRDSSGWDTRYLSWARLYGEVGFSGWVVGVDG
jgi:hypothetical protein